MKPELRASSLPKLAACPRYVGDKAPSDAAQRGTNIDALVRSAIASGEIPHNVVKTFDQGDLIAFLWTIQTANAFAFGQAIESREDELRVEWQGITGTMDLACWRNLWSADIKTGQIRDYEAQQALYALGCMDREFVDEWTMHLFFADAQQVVTHRFSRESAEAIVRGIVAAVKEQAPATPCDYCGWCALRFDCDARREQLAVVPLSGVVEEAKAQLGTWTPEKLRDFVLACDTVDDWREEARRVLLDKAATAKVPGVSVVNKAGKYVLPAERMIEIAEHEGIQAVEAAKLIGAVSEEKAKLLFPITDLDGQFVQTPGTSYVRVSRPKVSTKTKTTNQ